MVVELSVKLFQVLTNGILLTCISQMFIIIFPLAFFAVVLHDHRP